MQLKHLEPGKYRFERKFIVPGLSAPEIEMLIKLHPALFTEPYPPWVINNIYFDTLTLKNFFDNVDGQSERLKVRIRWYGQMFGEIPSPVLELKIKSGFLGRKESYKLLPFHLPEMYDAQYLQRFFENASLPGEVREELNRVTPTLINCYQRRYFISADKRFRVTLDTNLEFYKVKSFSNEDMHKVTIPERYIVEVKYGYENEKDAHRITSGFPFRLTKSSKYVDGLNVLSSALLISE